MKYLSWAGASFLLISLFFASCSVEDLVDKQDPAPVEEGQEFVIETGQHETVNPLKTLKKIKMVFEVRFDSTAIYTTKDPNNQSDVNKLFGMADCSSFHHLNSARFGWRWYQKKLELHAYSYKAGKITSTLISVIDLKKWYTCELTLADGKYVFKVNNKTIEQPRNCSGEGVGYQLYPYFGGDETAPHKIKIRIKEK
ncbi:hypothetical protein [Rufibacter sp. LB8]|uniref:hypothetical protein n=1 Tax=Rufibacter sp. LB8 TaxID=2777781 RepID=UPI00178C1A0D|nr:hypothetical protein [Rufibacter sp. LB8]